MIIHDCIGTDYRAAARIGFDWRGFVPVIDPESLIITDIIDPKAENTPPVTMVRIMADGTVQPGGDEVAIFAS